MSNVFSKPKLIHLSTLVVAAGALVLSTLDSPIARETDLRRFESTVSQTALPVLDGIGPISGCGPHYNYGSSDCGSMSGGQSGGPNQ